MEKRTFLCAVISPQSATRSISTEIRTYPFGLLSAIVHRFDAYFGVDRTGRVDRESPEGSTSRKSYGSAGFAIVILIGQHILHGGPCADIDAAGLLDVAQTMPS